MSVHMQPVSALNGRAKQALIQELGAVDTMRFLNQFRDGNGDYTIERDALLKDETVTGIIAGIKARRKPASSP